MSSQGVSFVHESCECLADTADVFWYGISDVSVPVEAAIGLGCVPDAFVVSFEFDVQLASTILVEHLYDLGAASSDAARVPTGAVPHVLGVLSQFAAVVDDSSNKPARPGSAVLSAYLCAFALWFELFAWNGEALPVDAVLYVSYAAKLDGVSAR